MTMSTNLLDSLTSHLVKVRDRSHGIDREDDKVAEGRHPGGGDIARDELFFGTG